MPLDADRLARCALDALAKRYPHKLDHLIVDEHDLPKPAEIHPVFDGCYDWHSSVHFERPYGWAWLLALQTALTVEAQRDPHVGRWGDALAPFARDIAARFVAYLRGSPYAVRAREV